MSATSTLVSQLDLNDHATTCVSRLEHSITHLKFDKLPDGTGVSIETKAFNPKESVVYVELMGRILTNIKQVRLAALAGQEHSKIELFSTLDREAIRQLAAIGKWTFSA